MEKTPKSLRLHIGLFGRTNVGKSSFLNLVAGLAAVDRLRPGVSDHSLGGRAAGLERGDAFIHLRHTFP